jgi:hypothetical protein
MPAQRHLPFCYHIKGGSIQQLIKMPSLEQPPKRVNILFCEKTALVRLLPLNHDQQLPEL